MNPDESESHLFSTRVPGDDEAAESDPFSTRPPPDPNDASNGSPADASDGEPVYQSEFSTRVDQSLDTHGDVSESGSGDASATASFRSPMRFRVLRPHAKGGLGQVSLAQDTELKRQVAVKEIQDRYADLPESQARFVFEAEVTGRLEHPGIVPVYALGRHHDGRPYYAMRFISGTAMDDAIKQLHRSPDANTFDRRLRDLLNRFISVCNTIDYAHSRGYIHRDLKPANVMLGEYAETLVVDWGLAKQIGAPEANTEKAQTNDQDGPLGRVADSDHQHGRGKTRAGRAVGTPQYMAPEQAAGDIEKIGPHTDIYCLGTTLYHLLTGIAPLADQGKMSISQLLRRIQQGEIPPPISVRPATRKTLDAICRTAMAIDPKDRYASARLLAQDIENELADERVSVVPESISDRAGRWMRKHRGITVTAGVSLFALTLLSTAFYAVTQSTLDRTRRYLQISQLEQQFDSAIHAETQRQRDAAIVSDAITPPESLITSSRQMIDQIETLRRKETPDFEDTNRRLSLLGNWTSAIEQLSRKRMNRDLHATLVSEVDRFGKSFPYTDLPGFDEEITRLKRLARDRIAQWYPVASPELSEPQFVSIRGVPTRASDPLEQETVSVLDTPPGNVQVSARFTGDTAQARSVGIVLSESNDPSVENSGYRFLLADQSYHPIYDNDARPSIAEANRRNSLMAFIIRGEDILRVQPVTLSPRPDAAGDSLPKLTARRERGTLLTFLIDDEQIRFEDLFPIPPDQPGQIGLVCPPDMGVQEFIVEAQRDRANVERFVESGSERENQSVPSLQTEEVADPIEQGDRAFSEGDFVAARRFYEQLPGNVEALAKTALTLEFLDPDEYPVVLRKIINDYAPEGVESENVRQWYLYAGVKLFLHYLRQPDERSRADWVLSRLRVNYDLEDVQSLIPEVERQSFTQTLLRPGKRTRVLFGNDGDIEELEGTIELLSNNPRWRRLAYWRKADALQYDWNLSPEKARAAAAPILDRLIEEMGAAPSADTLDWITIVRDRIWIHILDGTYDEGKALLVRSIGEQRERIPTSRLPLLIDRARLLYAEAPSNDQEAIDDLKYFLQRVNPETPPQGIHVTHYGEACGILGILYERRGDTEAAEEIWRAGRRRNWGPWRSDPASIVTAKGAIMVLETETPEPILAARTNGYSQIEWQQIVDELFAGSGLSDVAIRNMVFNSEQVPDEWIQTVAEKCFSGPRGRAIGDATLLHQIPLMQTNTGGVTLILYQAIVHLTMGGEEVFETYPEFDEIVFDRCGRLMSAFQEDRIGWNEMAFILASFTGSWNERSFVKLSEKLDDHDLSAGFALIFALMQQVKNDDVQKSRSIVENFVLPDSEELPSLYRRIATDRLGPFEDSP
ncbi:serine/threonine protein kinase [Rhodopirellula rubra]|uniref:Serine/threonine protein kinase n=1 Tax=Aporhodopirellula rubra TaxID=980271 RepID=A0A7W5E242_9BACT|nr:serine/threonine-protein kinase [Aporhodopirellula rubra]MBB3208799.1 serine/threonine protein kinase [Aporhodopirellula rubra]